MVLICLVHVDQCTEVYKILSLFPYIVDGNEQYIYGLENTQLQRESSSQGPRCARIQRKANTNYTPSANIPKSTLVPAEEIISKNRHLVKESKVSTLAVRLARDAFFGSRVLQECTVSGCRGLPALPIDELNDLKQTVFELFPHFWKEPIEFESLWAKCAEAIGQAAKGDRQKSQQHKS